MSLLMSEKLLVNIFISMGKLFSGICTAKKKNNTFFSLSFDKRVGLSLSK